ncbi:MAG: hypothetical protein A2745_03685 [Candidatus Harrisonbacteria bacterium RIFCSPHIGHO2_01_FULL_44_13]|uniref:DUF5667 domain-containing protein n=1 Tax=Candidatus Harrisonbacteria bacterium RIFCSPLOWO2_01_FULL_44_18 TaxID=1798407 RepID=A0A1G1ZNY6_9BACT|nr:MAG: hypothetical protein A2745_03685 [Candidatus Harrisonbacteria bacterium RIFCSPHIGHO2_01_FULL_44_13]OGY66282.1 MAG: hypothetical protein A3A16_00005 [Candidatus Harrisonbacteria bacterium RIFCSPLOWO2_01_FULL_44_18]
MIKKFIVASSLMSFLISGSVLPAMAQTVAVRPTKKEVSECMQAANAKKKTALMAAKDARHATEMQAKDVRKSGAPDAKKTAKELLRSARDTYKTAERAAKTAFAINRKACAQGAPKLFEVKMLE